MIQWENYRPWRAELTYKGETIAVLVLINWDEKLLLWHNPPLILHPQLSYPFDMADPTKPKQQLFIKADFLKFIFQAGNDFKRLDQSISFPTPIPPDVDHYALFRFWHRIPTQSEGWLV